MERPATAPPSEGFDSITLTSPDGSTSAEFVPDANLVCCSLVVDGDELLDRRRGVRAYADQGKTMGIPLLYPWANRLARFGYEAAGRNVTLSQDDSRIPRDGNGLPIHGVLPGLLRWDVEHSGAPGAIAARLRWHDDELLELFPFPHEVRCEAKLAPGELTLTTTVTASGDGPVPVSFGYHPYTRVPGAVRDGWVVTLGAASRLVLDDHSIPTGERAPVDREPFGLGGVSLDDGYEAASAPAGFDAAGAGNELTVEFLAGYPYAQVFAPPGQEFICFEPMTAPTNALNSGDGLTVLAPGESYRAEFRIGLSRGA
ncbi:MAG TPA: aldose 1-epimerase [Solirubrobacteraceae bacterium]|nr:aldose 1-epimerase [Solirubrobacteraceae bacterium]